ncbi:hypothetical protein BP1258A_5158 [Burkholderia pseudomallei 1258a]|uniref:Uncharacterized protein n=1 Tax=Burkholderia pseudomallei (strain 1026b) TaxID=884204 RepID=A0A0H3HNI6_BURP2|nr:hypothetical protein BP1026B_I2911 [Burkholderia pseudomallei 1026b]EIF52386.1 hypothetical protein BP1258B_6058 [Burkholderia pseudomallei 1258b]EIF54246.1 hypothetical protein BP1258A_5158 [Burkholderia pseudomallei 1258a]EIF56097.1 hypothetical protein BP1026A_4387 [Burkholderia pseudomallei 1026a]EIF69488.1 hypothetical protein BP354E_5658 [Burkholderia pseudomallei 354e]EIF80140.1 hypothetical protein BP354A_2656 [Burkholderia pseudomallei 354a]
MKWSYHSIAVCKGTPIVVPEGLSAKRQGRRKDYETVR